MKSKIRPLVLLCIVLISGAVQSQAANRLRVTDAWIRAAPPGVMVLAGYMTLENPGPEDIKITAAESPQFGMIELHRTVIEDDVARMRRQPYFLVPAEAQLVLAPNDRHLMMMMPKLAVQLGDKVTVRLKLDDGTSVEFKAILREGH